MALVKTCKKPPMSIITSSGSICTFNALQEGLPLKSHTVSLVAKQAAGTPSPSSPLPISGWDAIHIGNISDNTNISYFKGVLNGTYGFVDLGSLEWEYSSDTFYSRGIASTVKVTSISSVANVICAKYTTTTARTLSDKCIAIGYLFVENGINIKDSDYTDANAFKTAMNGVYLIYELATPTTPSFTSAEFEALCEAFGMNGQYATIQIGSTVYGGEYDARTGVFTATHKAVDLGLFTNWGYTSSGNRFTSGYVASVIKRPATDSKVADIIADIFDTKSLTVLRSSADDNLIAVGDSGVISVRCTTYGTDTNAFKTAMSGHYIVYELATPTTIQLPPCPIETLLGENNIWADTGATSLQYIKIGR